MLAAAHKMSTVVSCFSFSFLPFLAWEFAQASHNFEWVFLSAPKRT